MQLKKITLITSFMVILLICSLSTISAANNTINETNTGGIAQGITDTGTGDTLFLQPGTYNKTGQDNAISINKNITIQGNGSTGTIILDTQEFSNIINIFRISNNANVTFINITFMNLNNSSSGAGAVTLSSASTVALVNCVFTNNSGYYGGAIVSSGSSILTIINSTFINNSAISVVGDGGAIYTANSNVNIINSTFINNKALNGGAIRFYSGNNATIIGSNFVNNSVNGDGGAISAYQSNLTISDSFFTNNNASGNAGAISSNTVNFTVRSSNFTNNKAGGHGGAIWSNNVSFVTGSNFTNNIATQYGGTIYNGGAMSVSGNTMSGNSAGLGQMIYNAGTIGVLNLTFIDNSTWVVKNGSTITLYATLTDDMGNTVTWQNISFYLDGVFFENVTAIEGYANITYTTFNTGDIPVSGLYAGNGDFNILINNGLLHVRISTNLTISVPKEVKVGDTITLEIKLTDEDGNPLAGKTVDFYVDGVKVGSGVTDADGVAKLNYTFTKAGKPNVEAKFAGDNTYGSSNATNSTTVSKIPTKITVETNEDTITATLTDEDGNPLANKKVTITVNGKTYTKTTNSKGQVIIKYPNAWDYKVTANFPGDNQYLGSKATAPKRTPTKVTIKVKGDKITATLTDKNGKPIAGKKLTFRVKGVVIGVGITDANGQVVIYYKNANKKAVTVSFEGDNEYAPSSATSIPESDNVQVSGKVAMKNTGIPIVAMLLALIASMGLVTLRKRE